MAQATEPQNYRRHAGAKVRRCFPRHPVSCEASIGVGRHILRAQFRRQLQYRPLFGEEELSEPSILGDTRETTVAAVHVLSPAACRAASVDYKGMDYDRVAGSDRMDGVTHGLDPPGIFVTQDIWQGSVHLGPPDPLDNVEVGSTDPSPTDPDNDIIGLLNLRFRYFFNLEELLPFERFIELMKSSRLHHHLLVCQPATGLGIAPYGGPIRRVWLVARPNTHANESPAGVVKLSPTERL